jgi:hypothetical protein
MGRTLPSITQLFQGEEESINRFKRALRRSDQIALKNLFDLAQQHLAAAAYAAHPLPMEIFLLAMLMEHQKQIELLEARIAEMEHPGSIPNPPPGSLFDPE